MQCQQEPVIHAGFGSPSPLAVVLAVPYSSGAILRSGC